MNEPPSWHREFANVIGCTRCTAETAPNLLRDVGENVAQPGYVGRGYMKYRLLLVGQNPAVPQDDLVAVDRTYTALLRALRDAPTPEQYTRLQNHIETYVSRWPIHGQYFPLEECGLTLKDVAYCNLVRCRTRGTAGPDSKNGPPHRNAVRECMTAHFAPWVRLLKPRGIVFLGLWASDRARTVCSEERIPVVAMNRNRSLSPEDRAANRQQVVKFIRYLMASI